MSKAFTDEEALTEVVSGRPVQRAAAGSRRPMTRRGYEALVAQVAALSAELAAAGDEVKKGVEHRLALAQATLASVEVVEVSGPPGVVRFGSQVELRWEDGRVQPLTLVGPDETKGTELVSVDSPLGRALLGQREGALVEIDRPRGAALATVVRVS